MLDLRPHSDVIIESSGLRIVKMNPSMYDDVFHNSQDEDNKRFVPDEVFDSLEEAKDVVDFIISSYDSLEGPYIYAIIKKEDNANIGYVQLVKIDMGYEIGYHIAKRYTGNGYATKAVNLFLKYLKDNTELKEIHGIALYSNKASKRVLEKCGFKLIFEGYDLYQGERRKIIRTIKTI